MAKNNQFAELSMETTKLVSETFRELQRVAITTEERIQQRVRSSVRIIIASALFCISGIVSIGVNVGVALAHKGSYQEDRRESSTSRKWARHHRHAHRHWKELTTESTLARSGLTLSSAAVHNKGLSGKASWYGGKFQHRKTASGDRFDTHLLTAAHRSLPFGTRVRVTNTANNKTCIVEITDRGPYVRSRIIDLSFAAASELGFANLGTANVRIEVLGTLSEGTLSEDLTAQAQTPEPDAMLVSLKH